jgi:DNA-binding Lrp family transcriptional regulator
MMKAYVLVEAAIGKVAQILKKVQAIPSVVDANAVAGPYDLIILLQAETPEKIGQLVMEQIHNIPGVNYTMTCIAITGQAE